MRIRNNLMMLILFSLFAILVSAPISAQQPGECTNDVAASAFDDECGFLNEKIFDLDTDLSRTGIDVELDGTGEYPDRNVFLRIGFDSTEVGNRTWWRGTSDFAWTFDASDGVDPSFAFDDNQTTHTGMFEVEATTPTDESNFAGKFKLYQTANVVGDSYPTGSQSTFVYDATTEQIFQLEDDDIVFTHGSPEVTGDKFLYPSDPSKAMNKCYLIQPDDGSERFYVVSYVVDDDHLILTSDYINPSGLNYEGTANGLQRACGMSAFNGSFTVEGGRIARASAFEAKTPSVTGGSVYDACGVYIEPIKGANIVNPFGIYQAGTDDYNFMGGRLAIGADVSGHFPTNTVLYVDKHYNSDETLSDTNYGAYFEVTQGSSLYVTSQNRFPATLECKYIYDTEDPTPWPPPLPEGWDIRTKVIDGRFMVVNKGRINYAAGITGGVDVIPEYQIDPQNLTYPGVDTAVGLRGGITLDNIPYWGDEDDEANIKNAACLTTYINIDGGRVNRLSAVAVHTMDISKGHIEELTGLGIQPLIHGETDATFGEDLLYGGDKVYGIWQEGNEKNLFNGYMIVDTRIDTTFNDEVVSSYEATSTVSSDADIVSYTGFKYTTPSVPDYPNPANMYGIYLDQICPSVQGSEAIETYGIYQAGAEKNFLEGPLTIDKTSKVRAYRYLTAQTSTITGFVQVQLNEESYDILNNFNKTYPNNQFTASMGGYYQVNASVCFGGTNDADQIQIVIRKSGAPYSVNYGRGFTGNLVSLSISDIIPLSTNNTIQLWVYIPRLGISILPSEASTYLSIHKIS